MKALKSSKNNTKKKTAAKKKVASKNIKKDIDKKENFEIKGIVCIAVGILLTVGIYTDFAGFLSNFSQKIAYLLFGLSGYLIPIYIIYLSYTYLKGKGHISLKKEFYGVSVIFFIITLTLGTIFIQTSAEPLNFGGNLANIIAEATSNKFSLNGGVIAYFISYGLYFLIGGLGSYILYSAVAIISAIITFNISIIEIGAGVKNKRLENKMAKESKEPKDFEQEDEFINVVPKEKPEEIKEKNEFIDGVNNKIKILDFMKNSTIDGELDPQEEDRVEREIVITESRANKNFIDIDDDAKNTNEISKTNAKKGKTYDSIKESVSKDIDEHISDNREETKEYKFPDINLLNFNGTTKLNEADKKELIDSANKLVEILGNFNVDANVMQVTKGPSVTRYELQPSPGVKVSKIVNLADDIALGLAASGVRMEAPIPGKAAIGIEVPNKKQTAVFLREVLEDEEFKNTDKNLAFALGKDIAGMSVVGDLTKMPHTLIAGATGSGKSVCINSLIISILYKYKPEEVKLLMVDPKVVELNVYNGIPHLLIPVVTDPKKAAAALNWAVNEMTKRYNLFAEKNVRNIDSYNGLFEKGLIQEKMPFIVIIVDELADLMMACPNDVEDAICRLAQMARAAGMHLVIATQRPSVDVITGVIKANIPSRISFAVSSQVDSRTILDSSGAEKLLGKGDMLYYPSGESKPQRVQGCFISEEEVENVIEFIKKEEEEITYQEDIIEHINKEVEEKPVYDEEEGVDELLREAINLVIDFEQASTSFLQRRLRIGFNRASRIMDQLEERGIISTKEGSKPRQVLIRKEDLKEENNNNEDF